MRKLTKTLAGVVVVAAAGWFAGCNSTLDDSDANVVLEVENVTIPPVTAQLDQVAGTCTYTLTNANATFKNKPKNSKATTSPFNDIILQTVDIIYFWDDEGSNPLAAQFPDRTTGLGGSVPAEGSATAQFGVVSGADLVTYDRESHAATLQMTFRGKTVSGDDVSVTTGGTLLVNSCVQPNVGACCATGGACSEVSLLTCQNSGGQYSGDNTSCATTVCP